MSSSALLSRTAPISILTVLISIAACPIRAQSTTLIIGDGDEQRRVTLEPANIEDTPYLSLPVLMEELGGAYNLLPKRVRVDYNGTTAWLTVDDVRVHALSIFSLAFPIREFEGHAVIALSDVAPFFLKAFRARVLFSEPEQAAVQSGTMPQTSFSEPSVPAVVFDQPVAEPVNVIVIDAGHGGYDAGLVGLGGYQEKVLCLDIALRLKALLEKSLSQTIVLSRAEDADISAEDRLLVATESEGGLLITIHAGAAMTPRTSGITIFHSPLTGPEGPGLDSGLSRSGAQSDPSEISNPGRALADSIAGALRNTTSATLRGVHAAPVRLLQRAAMPGVMVEVGCLTNSAEETLLQTQDYRERIAQGIADGLLAYMKAIGAGTQTGQLDAGL